MTELFYLMMQLLPFNTLKSFNVRVIKALDKFSHRNLVLNYPENSQSDSLKLYWNYNSSIIFPPKQKSIMIRNFATGLMNENVLHLHLLMTRLSLPFNGGNFVLLSSIEFQFRYRRTDKIGPRPTLYKKDVSLKPYLEHLSVRIG